MHTQMPGCFPVNRLIPTAGIEKKTTDDVVYTY